MTLEEYVIDFFVIMAACICAAWIEARFVAWRDRKLDLNCDNCDTVLPLAKTLDKSYWLCKTCFNAYTKEHFPETQQKPAFRRRKRK